MHPILIALTMLLWLSATAEGAAVYFNPAPSSGSQLAPHARYAAAHAHLRSTTTRIHINYVGTPPDAATQAAIQFAAALLDASFLFSHDVNVALHWADLSSVPGLLGDAGPAHLCPHPDSAHYRYVMVPAALYSELTGGSTCPGAGDAVHIVVELNSNPPLPWYVGTDGSTPGGQIDLVTVAMHELAHGLGFTTGVANGNGDYLFAPYGLFYDWFVMGGRPGWPATYGDPVSSPCLASPGTLTNGQLYFRGNVGDPSVADFKVYAPNPFSPGSSIAHVDPSGSSANALMFPSLAAGEARHDIGGNVWAVMANFGYNMVPVAQYVTTTSGSPSACVPTCSASTVYPFFIS